MKKKISCILLLVIASCISLSAETKAKYVAGTFILKFRQNSEQYKQWLASGRNTPIHDIQNFIGTHSTEGYMSDATMMALERKYYENLRLFSADDAVLGLRQIAVVTTTQVLNLELLVSKINRLDFVEYAELMPERYLCSTPNDSLWNDVGQYYVRNTKANDAWDVVTGTSKVVIAIVDTGVDYNHEDLKDATFTNSGEMGTDAQGKDKRSNGIDDDNNGFIDDWHGWDFAGATTGSPQDNDPRPGYFHGTHCAGIAGATVNNGRGIAGMCNRASLLAVKIGTNNAALVRSYEGIAYSAAMGASIISCSGGGPGGSQAEQEVVNAATALGSLVVVAAGNNGSEEIFYPSAYKNVLSVAAVGGNDAKASFSNYGSMVGISAPGVSILSTLTNNRYDYMDGTSMATPCVAGAAGLVKLRFPSYTPQQIAAQLRATADNIDQKTGNRNRAWMYKMGSGRVNVYRAVTINSAKLAQVLDVQLTDADGDGAFDAGNTVKIVPRIQNLLAQLDNAVVKVEPAQNGTGIVMSETQQSIGVMIQSAINNSPREFSFVVPTSVSDNSTVPFNVTIYDDTVVVGRGSFNLYLKPTFRTLRNNNITVTVNSRGNIGFNDYSTNFQGEGLRYKGSANTLFEGGLMIASASDVVSNVVRGNPASKQDSSFVMVSPAYLKSPGVFANTECAAAFKDQGNAGDVFVGVEHSMLQFKGNGRDNFVITMYDITNNNSTTVDAMYAGIYADWDIDNSGQKNEAIYDASLGFYYVRTTSRDSFPWVGMQLLSPQKLNVFMMDNDGTTADNPGVYDNYTTAEKFQTLSSGIGRSQSSVTDVSAVIGAGPFAMTAGATERVAFSIFAGMDLNDLKEAAKSAKETYLAAVSVNDRQHTDAQTLRVLPNPVLGRGGHVEVVLESPDIVSCEIVDLLGNTVQILAKNKQLLEGRHIFALNSVASDSGPVTLLQGTYFVRLHTSNGFLIEPITVLP